MLNILFIMGIIVEIWWNNKFRHNLSNFNNLVLNFYLSTLYYLSGIKIVIFLTIKNKNINIPFVMYNTFLIIFLIN